MNTSTNTSSQDVLTIKPLHLHDLSKQDMPIFAVKCASELDLHLKRIQSGNAIENLPLTEQLGLGLEIVTVDEVKYLSHLVDKAWLIETIVTTEKWWHRKPQPAPEEILKRVKEWSKELLYIARRGHKENIDDIVKAYDFCIALSDTCAAHRNKALRRRNPNRTVF